MLAKSITVFPRLSVNLKSIPPKFAIKLKQFIEFQITQIDNAVNP
jgi:hypothetical protein